MNLSEVELDVLFKRLHLAHMRGIHKQLARQAEKESRSYRDFLTILLAEEVAGRKQTRLQRCTRNANFPFFKTIDDFDFSRPHALRKSLLGSCLGPDFVYRRTLPDQVWQRGAGGNAFGGGHRIPSHPERL